MSDPIYRQSSAQELIIVRIPVDTTITIQAFGSGDGFTEPQTMFGTDETIMISGIVVAVDEADLSSGTVEVKVNGPSVGTVGLSYDSVTGINFYQFTLGVLAEGDYTVEVRFKRLRV